MSTARLSPRLSLAEDFKIKPCVTYIVPEKKEVDPFLSQTLFQTESYYSLKPLPNNTIAGIGSNLPKLPGAAIHFINAKDNKPTSIIPSLSIRGWHYKYFISATTPSVVCLHQDATIGIWNIENISSPQRTATLETKGLEPTCFAEVSSTCFATGDEKGNIHFWDSVTQSKTNTISARNRGALHALISLPNLLISLNSNGTVNFYNLSTFAHLASVQTSFFYDYGAPEPLYISRDQKYLFVVGRQITLIDLKEKRHVATLHNSLYRKKENDILHIEIPELACAAFTPLVDDHFAIGMENGTIQIWNIHNLDKPSYSLNCATPKDTRTFSGIGYNSGIFSFALLTDGRLAYSTQLGISLVNLRCHAEYCHEIDKNLSHLPKVLTEIITEYAIFKKMR